MLKRFLWQHSNECTCNKCFLSSTGPDPALLLHAKQLLKIKDHLGQIEPVEHETELGERIRGFLALLCETQRQFRSLDNNERARRLTASIDFYEQLLAAGQRALFDHKEAENQRHRTTDTKRRETEQQYRSAGGKATAQKKQEDASWLGKQIANIHGQLHDEGVPKHHQITKIQERLQEFLEREFKTRTPLEQREWPYRRNGKYDRKTISNHLEKAGLR